MQYNVDFFAYYSGNTVGLTRGAVYEDLGTGKRFRWCQAYTTLVSTTLNPTSSSQWDPVVQILTTPASNWGIATDDVSAGLDATHPFCLGLPTSQCPVSTSSTTYFFFAQVFGVCHTTLTGTTFASVKMNNDNDAAIGDTIIMTSTDAACDTVATGTAGMSKKVVGYALVAVVASSDLVTGVYATCGIPF